MADKKISALTGASTPLAGTEVLPIVQGGSTVKVSVADLTAGRAVAMAGGSFTDNITQGTAAKGVNFTANTPAAGMTSQLLNAYEEGTYTATLTPMGGGSITVNSSFDTLAYTRIGRIVYVNGYITASSISSPTGELRLNIPIATATNIQIGERGSWGAAGINIIGSASSVTNGFQIMWSDAKLYVSIYVATVNGLQDASPQILGGGNTDIRIAFWYPCN